MIKILIGNEPYCLAYYFKEELPSLFCPEINLLKSTKFGEDELAFLLEFPMFSDKQKVVAVDAEDLKVLTALERYLDIDDENKLLIIKITNLDKRSTLYKKIVKLNCIHEYNKISEKQLKSFIINGVSKSSKSISQEALAELIRRGHYERTDIDLYWFVNNVKNLTSLVVQDEISVNDVIHHVEDMEPDNAFSLIRLILKKDISGLYHQCDLLKNKNEETIKILSLLYREYRVAYKMQLTHNTVFMDNKPCVIQDKLREELKYSMHIITNAIKSIQSGKDPEDTLLIVCLELAS